MNENIRGIVVKMGDISRDLQNLERLRNMTNRLPEEHMMEKEWNEFVELLEEAQEKHIDKELVVCQKAQMCVSTFKRLAPWIPIQKAKIES